MQSAINRRQALRQLAGIGMGVGAGLTMPSLFAQSRSGGASRPNILFVNVDDQPHDAMGFMGRYPFLQTPHMDRLAREGMQARNAFVTTSLCSPSRASFLSGQYAHTHGVRHNDGTDLPASAPHLGVRLQEAGYETAFVGKWHQKPVDDPRHGFDHWVGFKNQGTYYDQLLNVNGEHVQSRGYNADVLTDYAVDYLRREHDKPFMLCVWHKAIHAPFEPAKRHEDAFPDAKLPEPPNFKDTFEGKPKWLRRGFAHGGWLKQDWQASAGKPIPDKIPPREWNPKLKNRLDQLRCLLAVDESLGRLLDTLEETGQLDNTIVLFTSDNGYFFGEHRRQDKRLAYEESMRIPLLVRYPRAIATGSQLDDMVLNVDVPPTLLELAGVAVPPRMQGQSFAPQLTGRRIGWRDSFLYTYFAEPWWLPGIPSILAVRNQRWKYITYPEDPEQVDELYDLQTDPHELHNLASDPAYSDQLTEMQTELERLKKETDFRLHKQPQPVDAMPLTLLLHYNFANLEQGQVLDSSGKGHHGVINGATQVQGRAGTALSFNQQATVRIADPPASLDPSLKPLTISAWVRPIQTSGVVASYGGPVAGFSLHLDNGQPRFATRSKKRLSLVKGDTRLRPNTWHHLVGVLAPDGMLRLYVDGELAGENQGAPLHVKPGIGFTIGDDLGAKIASYHGLSGFSGHIKDVRLHWGVPSPELVANWANGLAEVTP